MPIIPVADWEAQYASFVGELAMRVPLERLTLGGICSYTNSLRLMERRLGSDNAISRHLVESLAENDGRLRYSPAMRIGAYDLMIDAARSVRPDLEVALCLEEPEVWRRIHERWRLGRCNCIL